MVDGGFGRRAKEQGGTGREGLNGGEVERWEGKGEGKQKGSKSGQKEKEARWSGYPIAVAPLTV